jgi:class 3 adenylate cyclase
MAAMSDHGDAPAADAPAADAPAAAPADALADGRAAAARHAWQEAFDRLGEADRAGTATAADLETLALAAFFVARPDVQAEVKERAYKRHVEEGNPVRAAYVAADIARLVGYQGKHSIASAWKTRAERLVGTEGETYAHGYLALLGSDLAAGAGELDHALELAERAVAIGTDTHDRDLTASAQASLGSLKIASGATADGFALMEEASIAAVSGDLSPFESGVTACRMIGACRDLRDYRRATEWIEATERYCDRQSLEGFPGICRIHRAEVAAVGGNWERAESELVRATTELEAYQATPPQADGFYAIGDIRRLRGEFEAAETALRDAHQRGRSPQPALALIRLAQGNVRAAAAMINAAVAEETWDRWARARLLPSQIEIAIAAGDLGRARLAVDELKETVSGYPSPALEAGCRVALGRVLQAEGDPAAAAPELRTGIRLWREIGAPYEVARAREALSRALRTVADEDDADLELRAAIDEYERLGARVDAAAAERELRAAEERRTGPRTARRTFMFTDVVGSTALAETLGDLAWDGLLGWHDDTLRALIGRSGGEIVKTTGDGVFAVFASARAAVDAAIAVQRAMAEHRASSGQALSVRIGLHTAEATQRGEDYSGMAVHVAARIGALAQGDEILASRDTLAEAGTVASTGPRPAAIRGATAPVEVASVVWS